jgi:LacI family transcriptional regulator
MITIYDIAKRTGYSAPTISKAINNQPDISEATKNEILAVAREMGYVPNHNAKALVTRKSWLIGVIFAEDDLGIGIEHPLFSGIMNAFKQEMEACGYEVMFISQKLGDKTLSYLEHCKYRRVDAVLILNHSGLNMDVLRVINSGMPVISTNILYPGSMCVLSENHDASIEAVKYLYSLGHTRIGHLSGPYDDYASAGKERLLGYREGLKLCGLEYDGRLVSESVHWNPDAGYLAMKRMLQNRPLPTAIYVGGDVLCVGVLRACREEGVRVPEDISIVGFDDNEAAQYVHPALTTFRQNRREIGQVAADLLLRKIDGETDLPELSRIPVRLVERESCCRLG